MEGSFRLAWIAKGRDVAPCLRLSSECDNEREYNIKDHNSNPNDLARYTNIYTGGGNASSCPLK